MPPGVSRAYQRRSRASTCASPVPPGESSRGALSFADTERIPQSVATLAQNVARMKSRERGISFATVP
jgi:hypothetical protein